MMLEKYTNVQTISESHKIYLVKSVQDNSFYVKKELSIYDLNVYKWLLNNRIKGLPTIKELIEVDNKLFVIEEYISGKTLELILEQRKIFTEKEVIQIVVTISNILKTITDKIPLVHRDIKPSNIIIKDDGEIYLIDFNTAKICYEKKSRDTILLGTEGYAAPEQYGFASSNIQTDIYAIGVLMKELLTGSNELNDNYSSKLKPIINKCTMMDPSARYADYQSLINQLTNLKPKKYKKYLPVGYRKGNIISIIIATIWYVFIFSISANLIVEGSYGIRLTIDRIGVFLAFVASTFYAGNYLNCQNIFHINRIKNLITRLFVLFISICTVFSFVLVITVIVESFF